jgi:heme/copper-type cytochrome/quinol oxidase subunit 4
MGWTIGVLGFDSLRGLGIFLFIIATRMALGQTQPPNRWVPGALSLGIKRLGVKLIILLHLVPKSKNEWSYTSTPQYALMAWCLVKQRDNFTFTFYRDLIKLNHSDKVIR